MTMERWVDQSMHWYRLSNSSRRKVPRLVCLSMNVNVNLLRMMFQSMNVFGLSRPKSLSWIQQWQFYLVVQSGVLRTREKVDRVRASEQQTEASQCTRCFLSPAELLQSAKTTIYFALLTLFQQFRDSPLRQMYSWYVGNDLEYSTFWSIIPGYKHRYQSLVVGLASEQRHS